ncbi:phenoloxidase-activating factor 2-like isoform X2 [Rhopalosiphum padi]|uniref:phenoloxidase-activating factor 2-like isoform X2 n=1 Tax=Rhopalosiphum padi TaxID=40932 RepID=UPI00298DEA18|nr:phenoloxidase-activating factor 2-like isoform X2 [Rhopalosiphum padi]
MFQNISCDKELEKCCIATAPSKVVEKIVDVPIERTICGHRNSDFTEILSPRINGYNTKFGEFPWMMAILKIDSHTQSKTFIGGGSLIHPRVVLTAIHALRENDQNDLLIRAGEQDSTTQNEPLPYQESKVLKIIKHEKFSYAGLLNDVALIILTHPFNLTENVGTICLPSQNYVFSEETCYASGWGKDKFGKLGEYQSILKKVDLPIVPFGRCLKLLRKTGLTQDFILHESFLCAGGEKGKDTCQGDGGSPLICPLKNNPKQYHQAGIVAWGVGCNNEIPGVYVNVAKFREWIDEKMAQENFDTSFYDPNYNPNTSADDFDLSLNNANAIPRGL